MRFARSGPVVVVVTLALATLGGAACGTSGDPTGATCAPSSTLTYANFGQAFMKQYCTECHAGKERPNLDTQLSVKLEIDAIDRTTASGPSATNTSMPEDHDISTAERAKLGEWLACGAP